MKFSDPQKTRGLINKIANRLRRHLILNDIPRSQFAREAGISKQLVTDLLNRGDHRKGYMTFLAVYGIARAMNISMEDLTGLPPTVRKPKK